MASPIDTTARWLDDRLRLAEGSSKLFRKAFPHHWTFLMGEVALFSLIVLLVTGTFLAFFYTPDTRLVTYDGPYVPLQGAEISAAFDSTLRLSFEVRGGLLMRQVHHWAAVVFVAAIVVHMLRVFFTGAFRKPRELNWVIGVGLLLLSFGAGFTGYSLPDDLLSGTGLRIGYSALLGVPFIGPLLGFASLGGEFPGTDAIGRLHILHVMVIPGALIGLVTAHMAILFRQKHTQKPSRLAREDNVVGEPLWPSQAFISGALFFFTCAVLALLGGVFEINPVWLYGPYEPFAVFAPAQPDWYMGWLEGLLRLWPAWEFTIAGITIPAAFLPGVVVPGAMFTFVALYPWFEQRFITKDTAEHHLTQRIRDVPLRAGIGFGGLALLLVIFVAGSNDVLAADWTVSLTTVTWTLRVASIVLPPLVGWVAYLAAKRLKEQEEAAVAAEAEPATG